MPSLGIKKPICIMPQLQIHSGELQYARLKAAGELRKLHALRGHIISFKSHIFLNHSPCVNLQNALSCPFSFLFLRYYSNETETGFNP